MKDLTAILLCGGRGERLKPFTDTLPKSLVPLGGKPLLLHLLRYLADQGIRRYIVCVGYKAKAIEQFVHDNSDDDWQVTCVNSGDASMTDRLLDARKYVTGPALVCYGDTLANVDLAALRSRHESAAALATLTVYPLRSPFGMVDFDTQNRVTAFTEKPSLPYWINIGFIVCNPQAFDLLKPRCDLAIYLSALAQAGGLFAYQHTGKHLTVNTEKERMAAENEIIEFYTYMNG